jgi:hypothetical protein
MYDIHIITLYVHFIQNDSYHWSKKLTHDYRIETASFNEEAQTFKTRPHPETFFKCH